MWPQNVESCSHNSKCDCNFQHFAVRFRNLQSSDCNFQQFAVTFRIFNILQSYFEFCKFCGHISNYDCNFRMTAKWKIAVADFKTFEMTATDCKILQSHFELVTAKCWKLQSRDYFNCSHNSKCDCKMLKNAVPSKFEFKNCSHSHVTVFFFKILQSYFELWLHTILRFCGHISNFALQLSNYDCNFLQSREKVTMQISNYDCKIFYSHISNYD